jgi:uncharacterized membrane protein
VKSELEERLFCFGMKWRIGYGLFRILFGLALLKVVGTPLIEVVSTLMRHELVEDPSDILYSFITGVLINHPLYITYFLALYFIFWGVLDVVLSYNLIKHRLWAFPASFLLICLFAIYEAIRFSYTHSFILLGVILLDTIILWIIWREFNKLKLSTLK